MAMETTSAAKKEADTLKDGPSKAALYVTLAYIINVHSHSDDVLGTRSELLNVIFGAVERHRRNGAVIHVDSDGRQITMRHLRMAAASERLIRYFKGDLEGIVGLAALAKSIREEFSLVVEPFLHEQFAAASTGQKGPGDPAHLADRIVSFAIRQQEDNPKAASPRFIQTMRALYVKACKTIEKVDVERSAFFRLHGRFPEQTEEEVKAEREARQIKSGFEQDFSSWDDPTEISPKTAMGAIHPYVRLLQRIGGEAAMRKELCDDKTCSDRLAARGAMPKVNWLVYPQPEPTST